LENKEKIFKRISSLISAGKEFAVATLISSSGGVPRDSGARMIVYGNGKIEYTIGGGALEKKAIQKSLESIRKNENINYRVRFKGGQDGMICGGEGEVFIEVFKPAETVFIFGGGHIALALAGILGFAGMPYVVVDDRPEFATEKRFPDARFVICSPYASALEKLDIDEKSYCVIVTHGHAGDKSVLRSLAGTGAAYIGMIGSVKKVKTVLQNLKKEGVDLPSEKIYSPVGIDTGGDTPGEIAISIAAEILSVKYGRDAGYLRESLK